MVEEVKGDRTWEWHLDQPNGSVYHRAAADFVGLVKCRWRTSIQIFLYSLKLGLRSSARKIMKQFRVVKVGNAVFGELEELGVHELQWFLSNTDVQLRLETMDSQSMWLEECDLRSDNGTVRMLYSRQWVHFSCTKMIILFNHLHFEFCLYEICIIL